MGPNQFKIKTHLVGPGDLVGGGPSPNAALEVYVIPLLHPPGVEGGAQHGTAFGGVWGGGIKKYYDKVESRCLNFILKRIIHGKKQRLR